MTVESCWIYKNGRRLRQVPLTPQGLHLKAGEFVWVDLASPSEAELQILIDRFHLHPLAIEDVRSQFQLPKLEVYGQSLFVVARTIRRNGDHLEHGEVHIFVGRDYILCFRHGVTCDLAPVRETLEAQPNLLAHGPDMALHAVLDYIVDTYVPVVDEAEDGVLAMEQKTLDAFLTRQEIRLLFALRRELIKFRRMLGPMEEVTYRLEHNDLPAIDPEARPYFRDISDHLRRVNGRLGGLSEVLASVFEVANLLEQQRQSAITRTLAAWAAILAVPTAVAGIYGMNFEHMPELKWTYGYPLVMGFMLAVCAGLFVAFKRSKWL
jgi:Mg2+ and Co2+ transporters